MVSWWLLSQLPPGIRVREGAQLRTKSMLTAVHPGLPPPFTRMRRLRPPTASLQALGCPSEEGFWILEDKWVSSPMCLKLPFQGSSSSVLSITFCGRRCDSCLQTRTLRFGMVIVLPKITS